MPIVSECRDCGKQYRFGDERAGTRVRCKSCGGTISVPASRGRARATAARALPPAGGRRSTTRRSAPINKTPIIMAAVVAGVLVVGAGLILLGMQLLGGSGSSTPVADSSGSSGSDSSSATVTSADLTDEQRAERDAKYQENLARQRLANSKVERDALARNYGEDKIVTIVFDDVIGDPLAANKYLNRKVFRAAYQDYQAGRERATQATEQNRKAAEQQALASHEQSWGGFGPSMVTYRYQQVESDVPYPKIVNGGNVGNSYTFHAAPALNPREFAERLGVGTVSQVQGREIHIQSLLPTPIPDPDVEELALEYGLSNVYEVQVQGAQGEPDRVQLYLENETTPLGIGSNRLSMAGMKALGSGEYRFSAGPVPDPQVFGERIPWGTVQNINTADRVITVQASLPETLPSKAELDAIKKKQKELEDAIQKADWERRPRPNETELEWAIRTIEFGDHWAREKALKSLAALDVDEARREEVSKMLITQANTAEGGLEHLVPAMVQWRTDGTEKAIMRLGSERRFHGEAEALLQALVDLRTEESAKALASVLPDFFNGDKSVGKLIEMGPFAEDAVLNYIKHDDKKVRERVYNVLARIGGKTSINELRKNARLENDARMKSMAEEAVDVISDRIKQDSADTSAEES